MKIEDVKELDDFKKYLKIDEHALDKEVSRQPELFFEVAQRSAIKLGERDAAKLALEQAYAVVSLGIREDNVGKKTTEGLIDQLTKSDDAYISYQDDYLTAKQLAESWDALKDAFSQRSFMLRELASLYIAGYFQTTSVKGTINDVTEIKYEERKAEMASKRTSRV